MTHHEQRPRLQRVLARAFFALLAVSVTGCVSLADRIVEPHSMNVVEPSTGVGRMLKWAGTVANTMRTPLGLEIAWYRAPSARRGWTYTFARTEHAWHAQFGFDDDRGVKPLPPRGTIVFVHGWGMDAKSMLPWAWAFAEHGYQGIAMDMRNFGRSGSAPVGFGPREAHDVIALVNVLTQRGELVYPVYLFGVSYGAATALFAESTLRDRVTGIIAMKTYANASEAVQDLVAGMLGMDSSGILGWLKHVIVGWQYGDRAQVQHAISAASRRLGLDLTGVDVAAALSRSKTCTLLIHGAKDQLIPVDVARHLARTNPFVRYVELPEETHFTVPMRVGWLDDPISVWLDATARGECPGLNLPEDPASVRDSAPQ